jgi:hypothetical protein
MSFARRYDTRITERIHEFLRAKHLTGQVEHEFHRGNVNVPTGWAILTVDSADPELHYELECIISNLERVHAAQPTKNCCRSSHT